MSFLAKIIRKLVNDVGIGTISTTFPSNHELSGKYVCIILLGFNFVIHIKKVNHLGFKDTLVNVSMMVKKIFPFKKHTVLIYKIM